MKKIIAVFTLLLTVFLAFKLTNGNIAEAESGTSPKIKLEVQFLEDGTNAVLSDSIQLEGDQGVFASISIPAALQGKYTVSRQGFDEASITLIQNGGMYSQKLIYQIFFTKQAEVPKPVQKGTYTLNVEEYDENGKNLQINYPDATDKDNNLIHQGDSQTTNYATTFGYYTISEEQVLVWCFDPKLPSNHLDKYEKRVIEENLDAALIQNFGIGYAGHEVTPLNASTEQQRLWKLLGTQFPKNPYIIERDKSEEGQYSNDNLRQLTEAEQVQIKNFNDRLDALIALYKSEQQPEYQLKSEGKATLEDGNKIVLKYAQNEREIRLSGKNDYTKQLIEGFKNGTLTFNENFVVYIDNNDIVVKVPRETVPGEFNLASMSLIRPEYTGKTVEYYSNYGNQPMQVNRIAKPKTFELTLEIKDGFIPNEPPVHEKPELKIPEVPKPKEEKPRIPEEPKPREEKPRIPQEPKEEPKKEEKITTEELKHKKENNLPNTGTKEELSMIVLAIFALVSSLGFSFYKKETI